MLGYTRQAMSVPFSIHGKSLLLGLLLLGALSALLSRQPVAPQSQPATMVIEHAGGTKIGMVLTTKSGSGLLDITVKSREKVFVSVPDAWRLTQVRGAPLSSIEQGQSAMGFARIGAPPAVTLTFYCPSSPAAVTVMNAPALAMEVSLERISLETGSVRKQSKLFTDPQVLFE